MWASQLQARYALFNPDAARPAQRVYVGNLPPGTTDPAMRAALNEVMVAAGGCAGPGFPVTACKLYPVRFSPFSLRRGGAGRGWEGL